MSDDFDICGKSIHLTMLHNPSHLEAVNPVSMGKARSKQQTNGDGAYGNENNGSKVLNVQVRICSFVFTHFFICRIHNSK